jgi:chloride channel protein, CIC family
MTGNFTLTLPVVLATGIAVAVSKQLTYGSIYTTKLLRRGIDIERPRPQSALQLLTVADVMRPLADGEGRPMRLPPREEAASSNGRGPAWPSEITAGAVTDVGAPQVLFPDEDLAQTLRQLALYGRNGLPVIAPDGEHLEGWVTRQDVLAAFATELASDTDEAERGALATQLADDDSKAHVPPSPLYGYELVEVTVRPSSPAAGSALRDVSWPEGWVLVAVTTGREIVTPRDDIELRAGERVLLLAPRPIGAEPSGTDGDVPD